MRYWVYKDSQILGPLAKEDFGLAGGVRPETLVCAEGNSGRMEADWRCAEEIGELSILCTTAPAPAGVDIISGSDFGLLERLQCGTRTLPGEGDGTGWLTSLALPASRIPETYLPRPKESTRQELKDSQTRAKEIAAQIEWINRRLTELETVPRQAPAPLKKAAAPPHASAPPPQVQNIPITENSPYHWDNQPAPGGGLPQAGSPPLSTQEPPAHTATSMTADALPDSHPMHATAIPDSTQGPPVSKGRPRRVVKISAPQSLRKVEKSGPTSLPVTDQAPITFPPPPATDPGLKPEQSTYRWGPQPDPSTTVPAPLELSAPPTTIIPESGMPQLTSPPQPVLPPPPTFAPTTQTIEAPPVPTLTPSTPTPAALPPMTMAFSGTAVMPPPAFGPSTQEVLAKLAKPSPAQTEPPKTPKSSSKTFLLLIGAASAVVVAAAWFFLFRDSKGLKTALQMDSGRPPVGTEVSDESTGAAKPQSTAPEPQTAQTSPQASAQPVSTDTPPSAPGRQAGGSTAPPQTPAAQTETAHDERPTAIALVKEFPLDGDRGTISQWLQYSFAATPGAQIEEKWDAGAYEESTYAVKYTVQPAGKDAITYLFEADVTRKTVKGMNATARKLLAGRSPAQGKSTTKARPAKPKKRTPPRRGAISAPKHKAVPLLPLPSDVELTPPAEDESAFRSDTVQPNL